MCETTRSFINADARCAACLVVYIDELMRSGFKGATEADVESKLDDVIVIFRYLQDKDVFENFYKSHLAKRLLNGRSLSHEAERSMLAKLKAECGCQFTTKLEGMFTDIKFSRDSMEKYFSFSPKVSPSSVFGFVLRGHVWKEKDRERERETLSRDSLA